MGNPLGVVAGVVIVLALAILSLVSVNAGISGALATFYGLYAIVWAYDNATQPRDFTHVRWLMSPREVSLYCRLHLAIDRVGLATLLGSGLNVLRMFGIVWAGLAFWQSRPVAGIGLVLYFVVCGSLVVRLNPYLYVFAGAAEGNPRLGEMAHFLAKISASEQERASSRD